LENKKTVQDSYSARLVGHRAWPIEWHEYQ